MASEEIQELLDIIKENQTIIENVVSDIINPCKQKIHNIEQQITIKIANDLKNKNLKEHANLNPNNLLLGFWNCEDSPTGECVYDEFDDPMSDNCLYCGEPDERK